MSMFERNIKYFNDRYGEGLAEVISNLPRDASVHDMYPEDKEAFCLKQVEDHIKTSKCFQLSVSDTVFDDFLEYQLQKKLYSYVKDDNVISSNVNKRIPLFIVFGTGYGAHLTHIDKCLDIDRLIIVEPSASVLRESMEMFDYTEFTGACDAKVEFIFNNDPFAVSQQIRAMAANWGFHNFINMHTYVHYRNNHMDKFLHTYEGETKHITSSDGFIGDERLGLAHCAGILEKSAFFLVEEKTHIKYPALIVGNGPSLNTHVDFIKENKDKMLICSCGSTLYTLHKNGITPHIHFEMERGYDTLALIRDNLPKKYLKKINLVTLCTSHPGVLKLFKRSFVVAKDNDINLPVLKGLVDNLATPRFMNPVVSNFCYAFLTECKFENIYLCGVDTGTKDKEVHHAKGSQYDEDSDNRLKFVSTFDIKTEANFGGDGYTTPELQKSISSFVMRTSELEYTPNVVNMSDGVKIPCFKSVRSEDVTLEDRVITDKMIKLLFKRKFKKAKDAASFKSFMRKKLHPARSLMTDKFIPTQPPRNEKEMFTLFQEKVEIAQQLDYINYRMIGGSINNLLLNVGILTFNKLDDVERWRKIASAINEFMKVSGEVFDNHLYNLDFPEVVDSYSGWTIKL